MGCELDGLMWEAWLRVRDRVLGDEAELRRRLARRETIFARVPRALCIAIRASDRRITEMNAWIAPRYAIAKGHEDEHQVQITSELIRELCRPVEVEWLTDFTDVSRRLGGRRQRCRVLERQGVLRARRMALLAGKRGRPVPVVTSGVPAMAGPLERDKQLLVLDACAKQNALPHELLVPYWRELASRLPDGIEQMLVRRPRFRAVHGRQQMSGWTWICPGCGRQTRTVYFPMGSADWAQAHGIRLPEAWYEAPRQPNCLACLRCHRLASLPRSTREAVVGSWSTLIGHMSGGLLYGAEVKRPASFGVARKYKPHSARRPSPSPRRDEMESYLAHTELSIREIARRMGMKIRSVWDQQYRICRMRGVSRRAGLKAWWAKKRPADGSAAAAA